MRARPMKGEDRLLIERLYRNKPHVGPRDSLADGFRIGGVCLVPLDVGLHILRRDQPHVMTKFGQSSPPVMCAGAGLDTDPARRQACQHLDQAVSVHATSQRDPAFVVDAVDLEDTLRDIESDGDDDHGMPLVAVGRHPATDVARAVHTIKWAVQRRDMSLETLKASGDTDLVSLPAVVD